MNMLAKKVNLDYILIRLIFFVKMCFKNNTLYSLLATFNEKLSISSKRNSTINHFRQAVLFLVYLQYKETGCA